MGSAFFLCHDPKDHNHNSLIHQQQQETKVVQDALDHLNIEEQELEYLAKLSKFEMPIIRKLYDIFKNVSQSQINDGVIDADEFAAALGVPKDGFLVRRFFNSFNLTETKSLNFREFATAVLSTKANKYDKMEFSFSLYDENGDGRIDISELKNMLEGALQAQDIKLSPNDIKEIINNTFFYTDSNHDNTIDFEEYSKLCEQYPRLLSFFTIDFDIILAENEDTFPDELAHEEKSQNLRNQYLRRSSQKKHNSSRWQHEEIKHIKSVTMLDI